MSFVLQPYNEGKVHKFFNKMAVLPSAPRLITVQNDEVNANLQQRSAYNLRPIEEKIISNLDREMYDILNNVNMSDERKVALYLHALKRYLTYKDKLSMDRGRLREEIDEQPEEEEEEGRPLAAADDQVVGLRRPKHRKPLTPRQLIALREKIVKRKRVVERDLHAAKIVQSAHHLLRGKVKKLLKHLIVKSKPNHFGWNTQGELIINGRLIPNSNVTKALQNVVKAHPDIEDASFSPLYGVLTKYSLVPKLVNQIMVKQRPIVKKRKIAEMEEIDESVDKSDADEDVSVLFHDAEHDITSPNVDVLNWQE